VQIGVDSDVQGSNTIELDFSFLADTTGQSGIAYDKIYNVGINYDSVENGDGGKPLGGGVGIFNLDSGIMDDGGSTATLTSEILTGPLFTKGSEVLGTVRITDLEANEKVVLRIDAHLACKVGSHPTGNLQGKLEDARVIDPVQKDIPSGKQTVPLKIKVKDVPIPEFPSMILPVIITLGTMFFLVRRKR